MNLSFPTAVRLAPASARGDLYLLADAERERMAEALASRGFLIVTPNWDRPVLGNLYETLDEEIERALSAWGAPGSGLLPLPGFVAGHRSESDWGRALGDQLFRARSLGIRGLCISLSVPNPRRLMKRDQRVLGFLRRATLDRPIVLLLDPNLSDAVHKAESLPPPVSKPSEPSMISHAPVPVETTDDFAHAAALYSPHGPVTRKTLDKEPIKEAPLEAPLELAPPPETAELKTAEVKVTVSKTDDDPRREPNDNSLRLSMAALFADLEPVKTESPRKTPVPGAVRAKNADKSAPPPAVAEAAEPAKRSRKPLPEKVVERRTERRAREEHDPSLQKWEAELSQMRGSHSFAHFEKLFVESYMPLLGALENGLDEPSAKRTLLEFRQGFAKSYEEALAMFPSTGKRPKMVLDVYDLALKLGRAYGAKLTQVVVVCGMRYDVGGLIKKHLTELLASRASLAEEQLLSAALPTTTMRQLETLARGAEALRTPSTTEEEPDAIRSRTADMVRRLRVGARELYKLDLVESKIAQAGAHARSLLPEAAEAAAGSLARHLTTQREGTLALLVGDHGFAMDRLGGYRHGGASPEEVLVPMQAWLVGSVH